ncbi:MAG: hypothetical protein WBC40_07480 [Halobacteriota archaeon]
MGTEKYIVILPVVELELDLYKFSENRYTWLQLWDDLKSLNGKCIFNKFKIFVNQEGISSSPPKLFILTLIDANSKDEAYKKGTEKILELVNSLVFLFLRGFKPIHHEAIAMPFCPSNHPLPIEDSIDLERIKVVIKTRNVDKIITPYGEWKFNPLLQGKASHKEYVTTYFKIRKTECDGKEIQIRMGIQKDELLNVENSLNVIESNIEGELKNTIATLYSAATTIENIPVSYLLLWQILESFASSKEAGGKLLAGTTMNNIKALLQKEGYDSATIHRINSMLGMHEKKNPTQIIAEIFREYLFPNENIEVLKQKVEKLKKIRNNITHPEPSKRLEGNELQTNYKELRGIVDKLLREIKNQKVSCET